MSVYVLDDRTGAGGMTNFAPDYHRAHYALRRDLGKASDHTCPCGKRAQDWAFDEPTGFSEDPSRYTALCRGCHRRLDAPPIAECSIDACVRPAYAHGICNLHYQRKRNGSTPREGWPA